MRIHRAVGIGVHGPITVYLDPDATCLHNHIAETVPQ